jgi:hypothetical protein
MTNPDYLISGHDYIGKEIRHHVPEGIVSIMPSISNWSDCTVVAYTKPTRRKGPTFHVQHLSTAFLEDLDEETTKRGLEAMAFQKYPVGAHELGFDTKKLKAKRLAACESQSRQAEILMDQLVEDAQGDAVVAALEEMEAEWGKNVLKSSRKKIFRGANAKQIWGRIVAGFHVLIRGEQVRKGGKEAFQKGCQGSPRPPYHLLTRTLPPLARRRDTPTRRAWWIEGDSRMLRPLSVRRLRRLDWTPTFRPKEAARSSLRGRRREGANRSPSPPMVRPCWGWRLQRCSRPKTRRSSTPY